MKRRSAREICNVLAMLAIFIGLGNEMAQASPRGEDMSIELEIRAWTPTLSASIQSSETSTIGNEVDLESTRGICNVLAMLAIFIGLGDTLTIRCSTCPERYARCTRRYTFASVKSLNTSFVWDAWPLQILRM